MAFPVSAIFIIGILGFSAYLIYSQSQQSAQVVKESFKQAPAQPTQPASPAVCARCAQGAAMMPGMMPGMMQGMQQFGVPQLPAVQLPPIMNNVTVQQDDDRYADSIKKQDMYMMYDPLTFPHLRLP